MSAQTAARKKTESDRGQVKANFDPIARLDWLDAEVNTALNGVGNPLEDKHAVKKRCTVMRVAYQVATGQNIEAAFKFADTCNDTVWHGRRIGDRYKLGWKELPEIQNALAVCVAKLVPWLERQKAAEIEDFRRAKQLAIARHAAKAPDVLAEIQSDPGMPPQYRIKAATDLLSWDAPEDAAMIQTPAPPGNFENTNVVINDDRRTAEIIDILKQAGALESVDDAAPDEVHPPSADDETGGVSASDVP